MTSKPISSLILLVAAAVVVMGCTPPGNSIRNQSSTQRLNSQKKAAGDTYRDGEDQIEEMEFDDEDYGIEPEGAYTKSSGRESDAGERFFQKGVASWYGREFHGKATASGDRFDMNALTAAHRTLPFGSLIEVKNLDNGKAVRVTVNDRGPYRGNRILDLSYKAARKLEMIRQGEAMVGITVLRRGTGAGAARDSESEGDGIEPVADDLHREGDRREGNYSLQVGAFYSRRNAEELRRRVEGITSRDVTLFNDGDMYKVRIEGIRTRNEASRVKRSLQDDDIPSYILER
ncbi:MAG: septal ring lytic transglycosylase RlpA family protein [Spirochaetes bacterium]|nr:septal ring lytic transglycosylase RlpA family protein [Spirochaetota bacterium]